MLLESFIGENGKSYEIYQIFNLKDNNEICQWFYDICQKLKETGHAHPGWSFESAVFGGILITCDSLPVAILATRADQEMRLLVDSFIYIEDTHRSRGLFHRLMDHLAIWGKQNGFRAMVGMIHHENQRPLDLISTRKDCEMIPYRVFVQSF